MKLEFLAEGSQDCPLIRLYAFDQPEVVQLRDVINSVGSGARTTASLHEEPWIKPVNGCELVLCRDERDRGVEQVDPEKFECRMSAEGWSDTVRLLEPLCESNDPDLYQWLTRQGRISILISANGTW